jgi:ferredoxin-type protein NapH
MATLTLRRRRSGAVPPALRGRPAPTGLDYRRLNRWRGAFQLFVMIFLLAVPLLNLSGYHWVIGTLYSISFGRLDIADPALVLQTTLLTRSLYVPLLLAAVVPMLLAFVLGRVFCSWMCPFNTMAEWLDGAKRRLFRRWWLRGARRGPGGNPRPVTYWSIFAGLLLVVTLTGVPLLALISAPGILSSQLSQAILGLGIGLELALVGGILLSETVGGRRVWCKYICPSGALLSLCRTPRTLRVLNEPTRCSCPPGGEACRIICPLGLDPRAADAHPYCFNCGSCMASCQKARRSALHFGFGRKETK